MYGYYSRAGCSGARRVDNVQANQFWVYLFACVLHFYVRVLFAKESKCFLYLLTELTKIELIFRKYFCLKKNIKSLKKNRKIRLIFGTY